MKITFVQALIIIVLIILWIALMPPHPSGSGRAIAPRIFANLKQIEIAKIMWAAGHNATGAVQMAEQDLTPYLHVVSPPGSNLVRNIICERYYLNPVGILPEAQLTQNFKIWPKGTIFSLNPTKITRPTNSVSPVLRTP